MCTLTFFYRPLTKEVGKPRGSLCIRLIHNRKVKTITTPFKLYIDEWDVKRQCLIYPLIESHRTSYLEGVDEKMEEHLVFYNTLIRVLEEQGRYTVDDVLRALQNRKNAGNLIAYGDKLANDLIKSGQERTARAYGSAISALVTFNKAKDIPLKHISSCLINEFEHYLKDQGKSLNTISFYMRNLRAIYNKAIRDHIITTKTENPFGSVFTGVNRTRKRALTLEEISKLYNFDFSIIKSESKRTALYRCWRFFFFCFHARGMSFVDMAYLRPDNIRKDVISYYRRKTGQPMEVKITPILRRLIDSFANENKFSSYLFPVITDIHKNKRLQYESALRLQNKLLKELNKLAGLKKPITTHMSRHSWATIAKHEQLPLSIISEGLGHSNEKTTYIYLASFERSRLDEANDLISAAVERAGSSQGNNNGIHSF